jgi:Flagellar assembly protein T, C-terminal domain
MNRRIFSMCLNLGAVLVLCAGVASAQKEPTTPTEDDMYCSNVITPEPLSHAIYVIAPEQAEHRITAITPDLLTINKGSDDGVKVGDEFLVMRAESDPVAHEQYFKGQNQLLRAMGTMYVDLGRLRVVNVQAKTAIAKVTHTCDWIQRDDIVIPFAERPAPTYHPDSQFDIFAPPSGKPVGMLVTTKNFGQTGGFGTTVYVNLGSKQGVQVGDYIRIFRHEGERNELTYQDKNTTYEMYGFGSDPVHYTWKDLPREVLGEGIVVRVGPNASTVLVTHTRIEFFAGDYVEIE